MAASITHAAQGQDVRLSLGPALRREGDVLQFSDTTYRLSHVKSASRTQRQADRVAEIAYLLIVAALLCMALTSLVGYLTDHGESFKWLRDIQFTATILFGISGFAICLVWSVERKTRYVHIVELRGTFGRRNIYATLDQAEADAIVATINNEIRAGKLP